MDKQTEMTKPSDKRTYRGKNIEQRQQERRVKLVQAGVQLFGTVGFHTATVKSICHEAGLTERYFYESFENTHALFAACYLSVIEEIKSRIFGVFMQLTQSHVDTLVSNALTEVFTLLKNNPSASRLIIIEVLTVSRDMEALSLKTLSEFVELVQAFVAQWKGESMTDSSRSDLLLLASGLLGTTLHIAARWAFDGYQQPIEQVVKNCTLFYLSVVEQLKRDA